MHVVPDAFDEGLVDVGMTVDQAGQGDTPARVNDLSGLSSNLGVDRNNVRSLDGD